MRRCPRGSGGIFLWRISGVRRGKQTTMFPATLDELIPLDHMCRNWRPFSSQSNSPKLATFAPLFKHLPTAHAPVVTHRRARVRQCFADPPALFLARIVDHLHISDLHMAVLGIAFFHVCIGGRILGVFFQVMRGRVGHDSRG